MCQAFPYQSLSFLDDRGAVIYALHAARGPLLIYNGLGDDVVAIPSHSQDFFNDLRARTIGLCGEPNSVFETGFAPVDAGHRPYWVTRPVVEWLEKQIGFPNWTEKSIASMPEIKITEWARKNGVSLDKLYATDKREGGTPVLDAAVPGIPRDELNVFSAEEWASVKKDFVLESWVQSARTDIAPVGLAAKHADSIP